MARVVKYPRQITVRFIEDQYKWLKSQARKRKVNKSDIIRELIDRAINEKMI